MGQREKQASSVANGRRGGLATLAKWGRIHFVLLGMRGGRPTWQQSLVRKGEPSKPNTPGESCQRTIITIEKESIRCHCPKSGD